MQSQHQHNLLIAAFCARTAIPAALLLQIGEPTAKLEEELSKLAMSGSDMSAEAESEGCSPWSTVFLLIVW
jgi:hypothetical protein